MAFVACRYCWPSDTVGPFLAINPCNAVSNLVTGVCSSERHAHPADSALRGPVKAALAGVMLVNVLVLRQASWLTPAESWHAFHFVVACWLLAIYTLLVSQRAEI